MYICYLDESGSPDLTSNTSHFVLLGLAIPAITWRYKDEEIRNIKRPFDLEGIEIHTGWMFRRYLEQERIKSFESLSREERRKAVYQERKATLLYTSATKNEKALNQLKINYKRTEQYIHLTRDERLDFLRKLGDKIGLWTDCRLFGEAVEKAAYNPKSYSREKVFEDAFTEIVSRFQYFLENYSCSREEDHHGILVQDNNPTVTKRLTARMKEFHTIGTLWTDIPRIIETPLFVDSSLTGMVQMADLCVFATRRFFENSEIDLFDRILSRFDRAAAKIVGLRHFTKIRKCSCKICENRRLYYAKPLFPDEE